MLAFDQIRSWCGQDIDVNYSDRDALLYSLSVGLGGNNANELCFVYEKGQVAAPTLAMVVGHHVPWLGVEEHRIDRRGMLHGESSLEIQEPLPVSGTVVVQSRIDRVVDRGSDKGAAIYFSNKIVSKVSGATHATVGGCFIFPKQGGPGDQPSSRTLPRPEPVPDRTPDATYEQGIPWNAAQLYRLTGDRNPLHVDPQAAQQAGQERPILHGLCTFGFAAGALLRVRAGSDASRFRRISARYAAPVFPGETLRTEVFDVGHGQHAFRCLSVERKIVVVNNGFAVLRGE